jgi:hypothetical protein
LKIGSKNTVFFAAKKIYKYSWAISLDGFIMKSMDEIDDVRKNYLKLTYWTAYSFPFDGYFPAYRYGKIAKTEAKSVL